MREQTSERCVRVKVRRVLGNGESKVLGGFAN